MSDPTKTADGAPPGAAPDTLDSHLAVRMDLWAEGRSARVPPPLRGGAASPPEDAQAPEGGA